MGYIRLTESQIQNQIEYLHIMSLPIYATQFILIGLATLLMENLSNVIFGSICVGVELLVIKYFIQYRDYLLSSVSWPMERISEDPKQLRLSGDFLMTEHITRFTGISIAFCVLLAFNLDEGKSSQVLFSKFLACLAINALICFVPIILVWWKNEYIVLYHQIKMGIVETEIGGQMSDNDLSFTTSALFAVKRRHVDMINVWCSKHSHYKKHYILTLTSVCLIILRIMFDPQQFICYDDTIEEWVECLSA